MIRRWIVSLIVLTASLWFLAPPAAAATLFDDFSTSPFAGNPPRWCERFHHVHWIDSSASPIDKSLIGVDGTCCVGLNQCGPCDPIAGVGGSCGNEDCLGSAPLDPDASDWPNCRNLVVTTDDFDGDDRRASIAFGVPAQLSAFCDASCPGCDGDHIKVATAAHPNCEASIEARVIIKPGDPTKQALQIRSVTSPRAGYPECGTTTVTETSTIDATATFTLATSTTPRYELSLSTYRNPSMPSTKLAAVAELYDRATESVVAVARRSDFTRPAWYNVEAKRFAIGGMYGPKPTGQVVYDDFDGAASIVPPDPADPLYPNGIVGSPIDDIVATDVLTATEFLYTPQNPALPPIQTAYNDPNGVLPAGTIEAKRAAVIRGRVLNEDESPLPGVRISILGHEVEFGQTYSRLDGYFDLAVNGGGSLILVYEEPDHITVHRKVEVPWQQYASAPDVVMLERHPAVAVTIGLASGPQVVQGLPIADDNPANAPRKATLIVPANTTISSPAGLTGTLNLRATEVTTKPGEAGKRRMPAALPPESGYTYAVEFGIDEAEALGADSVTFNQDLWSYVDNFLGFPVGEVVPAGYYDRVKGAWIPSTNGKVIEIISVTGGLADIDTDGDTIPDNIALSNEERQALGELFDSQQIAASLWRVPIRHFSAWDYNWPIGPPDGSGPPAPPPPDGGDPDPSLGAGSGGGGGDPDGGGPTDPTDPCDTGGSIIECQSQVLGERIPLVGSPFTLNYRSNRVPGYLASRTLTYRVDSTPMPPGVKRILVEISIAGRTETQSLPATATGPFTFAWDGKDGYNRTVYGAHRLRLRIGYVYDGSYRRTTRFGYYGNGVPITGDPGRAEITIWKDLFRMLSNRDTRGIGLGGWTLDVHHSYDPASRILFEGNGRRRAVSAIGRVVSLVGGNGGFTTGGGPVIGQPAITRPFDGSGPGDLTTMAATPDGNIYFNYFNTIRRIDPGGIVRSGAQNLYAPPDLAAGRDGSVFVADHGQARIFRIINNQLHEHVAGNGGSCIQTCQDPPDGSVATQVPIWPLTNFAVAPDGTIYYLKSNRLRRINRDGTLGTVSGGGTNLADNIPAIEASLPNARHLAIGADGVIYVSTASQINNDGRRKLRKIGLDGRISTVAGVAIGGVDQPCNLAAAPCGDGGPAKDARISITNNNARLLTVGDDGSVYFVNEGAAIRRISPDGIITTVAGTIGVPGPIKPTLGAVGQAALLRSITAITIGRDGDLFILTNGQEGDNVTLNGNNRLLRLGAALESANEENGKILIPSTDGREVFEFNGLGKHLRTLDAFGGSAKYLFTYGATGLTAITDAVGNETVIDPQPLSGGVHLIAPGDKVTSLSLAGDGFAANITDPAQQATALMSSVDGLLSSFANPRGAAVASTFQYDSLGRLLLDEDASGGSTLLTRVATTEGFDVTLESALQRLTTYRTAWLEGGVRAFDTTRPGGLTTSVLRMPDGTAIAEYPDGTTREVKRAADPRFGMRSPFLSDAITGVPGNPAENAAPLTSVVKRTRKVSLSSPLDPLSLSGDLAWEEETKINGHTSRVTVDANVPAGGGHRVVTYLSRAGRSRTLTLDVVGRPVSIGIGALYPYRFTYDSLTGLVASVKQGPSGAQERSTVLEYDSQKRRLASVTNPLSDVRHFTYDDADRIVGTSGPGGIGASIGYDGAGNRTSLLVAVGKQHTFDYSAANLEVEYVPPSVPDVMVPEVRKSYNADHQLERVELPQSTIGLPPAGYTMELSYDSSSGRLISLQLPESDGVLGLTYDTAGRLSEATGPDPGMKVAYRYNGFLPIVTEWGCASMPCAPGTVVGKIRREFDANFRVVKLWIDGVTDPTETHYDPDGLISGLTIGSVAIDVTRDDARGGLVSGITTGQISDTRIHTDFGEREEYAASFGSQVLMAVDYERDKLGRIVQKNELINGVSTTFDYTYDAAGNLIRVDRDGIEAAGYSYDSNGNRLTQTGPGGVSVSEFSYDAQDRLVASGLTGTEISYEYQADGSLARKTHGAQSWTFHYDALGNLRRADQAGGISIRYVIDAQGRRIGREVDGNFLEGWLYDDQYRIVARVGSSGAVTARFVYSQNERAAPDVMITSSGVFRMIADANGSIRLVVNIATGVVAQRIDYDEFGRATIVTGAWDVQPFGFAGGLYDPATNLVRFGRRDYDPETGRWVSKDPIGFAGQQGNLYVYVGNDPINATDRTGLDGTNDCSHYARRCVQSGGSYYCETAPYFCDEVFPKPPDPDPSRDDDYEGVFRCIRKCLQDCDQALFDEKRDEQYGPGEGNSQSSGGDDRLQCGGTGDPYPFKEGDPDPNTDGFWDGQNLGCHLECYTWCPAAADNY